MKKILVVLAIVLLLSIPAQAGSCVRSFSPRFVSYTKYYITSGSAIASTWGTGRGYVNTCYGVYARLGSGTLLFYPLSNIQGDTGWLYVKASAVRLR